MVLRTSLTPLGCASPSPFNLNDIIFQGRPQPEKNVQNNIQAFVKLYKNDICEVIAVGGGSNSAYGGWSGYEGGSGAAFKGRIKILKTVEIPIQVGAKTDKNTYPLSKPTFLGDFIIAGGATGATDNNWDAFAAGNLTVNQVDWAELYGIPEIQNNGQRSASHQPMPGKNYGQEYYTGYLCIIKVAQ